MDTIQKHEAEFKVWFEKTIKEQHEIRQELIGQSIVGIFYTPKVEGWDINIKDNTVIHLPYGYLTFVTKDGANYRIHTNYQTFCGGIFGIMLEKIDTNETHNPVTVPLINYMLFEKRWNDIKGAKITQIDWNWKREPECQYDEKTFTIKEVEKYLFEDCFAPDNLAFHFDNNRTVYFFALELDEEVIDRQTYKFISGGEEIMIFIDKGRLHHWGITTLGFQIKAE